MVIPEKLLKASDKELDRLLSDNVYTSKFVTSRDYLLEILNKKHNIVTYQIDGINESSKGVKEFFSYYKPLTKVKLNEFKTNNILKKLYTSSLSTKIKYLNSVIGRIIAPEYYDITSDIKFIYVVIHYPEITITNSVEQSHLMRDIYVKLVFSYTDVTLIYSNMYMARTTYTTDEYTNNYIFSHLGSCNLGSYYNGFCFGDDTPTVKAIDNLKNGNISNLSSFIYLIKEYLSWESLEGTPYRKIEDIPSQSPFTVSKNAYTIESVEVDPSTDFVLSNLQELNYTYQLRNGSYIIQLDHKTVGTIDELLTAYVPIKYYLVHGYSCIPKFTTEAEQIYSSQVKFKGASIPMVVKPVEVDSSSYTLSVHTELLDLVVNKIEHKLEEFIFNKNQL